MAYNLYIREPVADKISILICVEFQKIVCKFSDSGI
jgi:hypothetical protein